MNPVTEIITELKTLNVELWVENDNLRFRGPKEVLTADIVGKLKQYKPQLIKFITHNRFAGCRAYPQSGIITGCTPEWCDSAKGEWCQGCKWLGE